jgi:hypothetical protein
MSTWAELQRIFTEDHREMMRGFQELIDALRARRDQDAVQIADRLDQSAGPHIEFEEKHLYPIISQSHGPQYTSLLYEEHSQVLDAIRTLQNYRTESAVQPLTDQLRERLIGELMVGIDHATTCGTLLGRLTSLPPEIQEALLERLEEIRKVAHRWTELKQ